MLIKYFIVTIMLCVHAGWGGGVGSGKISKYPCNSNNNKLLSLLNLLCNSTQTTSVTSRDACYGCFFRAGALPTGPIQLNSLSQCATMYLVNTTYSLCATNLQAVASGARPTTVTTTSGSCYTGYCDFVRCVRRVNANTLVDNCIQINLQQRNLMNQPDRINFYTNTTSCILARTRCNQYNPITGEIQNVNRIYSKQPNGENQEVIMSNSLQISTLGDIRVIQFPMSIGISEYFCLAQLRLDQAAFGDAAC